MEIKQNDTSIIKKVWPLPQINVGMKGDVFDLNGLKYVCQIVQRERNMFLSGVVYTDGKLVEIKEDHHKLVVYSIRIWAADVRGNKYGEPREFLTGLSRSSVNKAWKIINKYKLSMDHIEEVLEDEFKIPNPDLFDIEIRLQARMTLGRIARYRDDICRSSTLNDDLIKLTSYGVEGFARKDA